MELKTFGNSIKDITVINRNTSASREPLELILKSLTDALCM